MGRKVLSTTLIVVGLSLLLASLGLWGGASAPVARAQPQPPPRPTLTPIPTPKPSTGSNNSSAAAPGRITGTVIDLTTGAPAPGIAVVVGDATVTTDANGNYDRNGLAAGSYPVALALTASQGTPAQGTITVVLAEGATVVQHLAFHSLQPATPTSTPAPTPVALPTTGGTAGGEWIVFAVGLLVLALGVGLRSGLTRAR